jgi:hypothetical protein
LDLDNSSIFLNEGEVKVLSVDKSNRQALLFFNVPLYLAQSALPALLYSGVIESFSLSNPISVFIPNFKDEDVVNKLLTNKLNSKVSKSISDSISLYKQSLQVLKRPSDIISLLPVGVYVSFAYKCSIDAFISSMNDRWVIEENSYEHEFKWAVSKIMASILNDIG